MIGSISNGQSMNPNHMTNFSFPLHNWEVELIHQHLSAGWIQENITRDFLVFSTHLGDGTKWTRHYARREGLFQFQDFERIQEIANNNIESANKDWPPIHFGD